MCPLLHFNSLYDRHSWRRLISNITPGLVNKGTGTDWLLYTTFTKQLSEQNSMFHQTPLLEQSQLWQWHFNTVRWTKLLVCLTKAVITWSCLNHWGKEKKNMSDRKTTQHDRFLFGCQVHKGWWWLVFFSALMKLQHLWCHGRAHGRDTDVPADILGPK